MTNIAYIVKDKVESESSSQIASDMYKSFIITYQNYSQCSALMHTKFDAIFLFPEDLNVGRGSSRMQEIDHPSYLGRKVLTDIIRNSKSVNNKTPTAVIIDFEDEDNDLYTKNGYKKAKATAICNESEEDVLEFTEEFLKKHLKLKK